MHVIARKKQPSQNLVGGPDKANRHRFLKGFAWYVFPVIAFSFVLTYFSLGLAWGVFPPFVPVQGGSMTPFLRTGDIVLLHQVNPSTLKVGQVIAVETSKSVQQTYGVPAQVVHRIVKIEHTAGGLAFKTKGDANSGPDVFITYAPDVVGLMIGKVPYLGYPVVFFKSRQGEIFAAAMAFVALVYLGFLWKDRRHSSNPTISLLAYVIRDISELKDKVQPQAGLAVPVQPGSLETDRISGDQVEARSFGGEEALHLRESELVAEVAEAVDHLERTLHEALARQQSSERVLAGLTDAVYEYGLHLKSHTSAIQGLAGAATSLESASQEIHLAITSLFQSGNFVQRLAARSDVMDPVSASLIPETIDVSQNGSGQAAPSGCQETGAISPPSDLSTFDPNVPDPSSDFFDEPISDFTRAIVDYYKIHGQNPDHA